MSTIYLHVNSCPQASVLADSDIRRLCLYKRKSTSDRIDSDWVTVANFGRECGTALRIARREDGSWMCHAGYWIHRGAIAADDLDALLKRFIEVGADVLAKELDGVFAIAAGNALTRTVSIITDAAGSMHMYARRGPLGIALSNSSLALSLLPKLDAVGLHEFVATGVIYERRSLWNDIEKLPPASILEIGPDATRIHEQQYWRFADIQPETLGLEAAADAMHAAIVETLRPIGRAFPRVLADLTGGYDSRILLCGMLSSGIRFDNTVSGPRENADFVIASRICERLGTQLLHTDPVPTVGTELVSDAIRLSDGECDVFDTARILFTHRPASQRFDVSLNGSFGELARGYWWELLWPDLASAKPLDVGMVARRRFAAAPYETSLFETNTVQPLVQHMSEVASRAIADIRHLPNTSQMDGLYLRLRMQRWQGRIASTTNQIWPALSPLASTSVLSVVLAARATTRFRSLLPRTMFARKNNLLASIPLEHGYPPCPANLSNLYKFWPVATHYGRKVTDKLRQHLGRAALVNVSLSPNDRYQALFKEIPIRDWIAEPMLLESGLFDESKLKQFLDPRSPVDGHRFEQWKRLVSVEFALRAHHAVSARP